MGQVTFTAYSTLTKDGVTVSQKATYVADAQSIAELTDDVSNTYKMVLNHPVSGCLIENIGSDAVLVSMACGATNFFAGIPVGGHIFLPGAAGDDADGIANSTAIYARSVTSAGSKIAIAAAICP